MPVPVLILTVTPKTKADQEKLIAGLRQLVREDPTLRVQNGPLTGQAVIAGVGELQLEIVVERLRSEFGVDINAGEPQVAYRQTVRDAANGEAKYAKQAAGRGHYAHVKIRLLPGVPGVGYVFENKVQDAIPQEYINPIDEGIKEAFMRGVLAGLPADVRVELHDGSYYEGDSSDMAFKMAGSMAFQDAAKHAKPVLLEPVMRVEVNVPREYLGDVAGNLSSRRAQIECREDCGATQMVTARVPLSTMLGYGADLRERTQGRATFALTLDRYEPIGGPDPDDDRHSYVGWPVTPRKPLNTSAIALPEPD
jgi:elongation factor G